MRCPRVGEWREKRRGPRTGFKGLPIFRGQEKDVELV